jgi:hypothetical protein
MIWLEWVKSKCSRYVSLIRNLGMILTKTASLWIGEHDRSFLWTHVHMGEFTCVSCDPGTYSSSNV